MNTIKLEAPRQIVLEGAHNVRDLGGYPTAAGETRWSVFLRADSLHQVTAADLNTLLQIGIRTVIDLRHASEVQAAPNRLADLPQIAYHNIPIFRATTRLGEVQTPTLQQIYSYIVDHCQAGLSETLFTLIEAQPNGVLFHCSAGKDRAGIVAALILGLAGVDKTIIAADYALTGAAMPALRPVLLAQTRG